MCVHVCVWFFVRIQGDLVHTIGEGAAIGASGAVLWGSSGDYDDKVPSLMLKFKSSQARSLLIESCSLAPVSGRVGFVTGQRPVLFDLHVVWAGGF